jgi:uncharacterized membrane protein YbhN (UPF0104 family)
MLDQIADRIAGIDPRLGAAALVLHMGNHLLRSAAWRNVIAAAYPERRVPYTRVLAGYASGVAVNALAPARGGDAVKLGLIRAAIPGSTITTLAATMSVLVVLDLLIGTALVLTVGITGAVPLDPGAGLSRVGGALPVLAAAAAIAAAAGWMLRRRIVGLGRRLRQGGAILRTPGRYLRAVATPQLGAWACRVGVVLCLLAAFGLPATVPLAGLVMVVSGASTIVPLTPGGAGTQQVALAVALSQTASATAVVSFSLAMQASVTAVNALLGVVAAMAVFRTAHPLNALRAALAGARA